MQISVFDRTIFLAWRPTRSRSSVQALRLACGNYFRKPTLTICLCVFVARCLGKRARRSYVGSKVWPQIIFSPIFLFIYPLSLGFRHFSLRGQEIVVTFEDVSSVFGNSEVPPMWNWSCDLATLRRLQVKSPSMSVNLLF